MARARARRPGKLVLMLAISLFLVALIIYDRSSYQEKVFQKLEDQTDWSLWSSNIELRKTSSQNILMDYLSWTNQSSCKQPHLFGGNKTGNYLCLDLPAAPRHPCLVYSFDFFRNWPFEKEISDYFCKVYSFDPAILEMELKNWTHPINDLNSFMKLLGRSRTRPDIITKYSGLKPKTVEFIYEVIKNLLDEDETKILDYLKLDIGGEEWEVIPMMIRYGLFSQIRQLGVKFHLFADDLEYCRDLAIKIREIESEGMIRFHSKEIPCSYSIFQEKWPEDENIILPFKCFDMAWYQVFP